MNGIHLLLTYSCNFECDHCFLYCSPRAEGVFTLAQLRELLDQGRRMGSVEWIYFEGGEPFLYHPLLVEGLRLARGAGFRCGVVTNCYWATAVEDAELWLGPLAALGVEGLSVSDDPFHHGDAAESPAQRAVRAAENLEIPASAICIEQPKVRRPDGPRGQPVVGGGALFKGRAADRLTGGLPTRPGASFRECSHEELVAPDRVHIDPFGNVQVCQGVSIGNAWDRPLSEIVDTHDASAHPICGPLSRGGPAELARTHGVELDGEFVDECHYCFEVRRTLLDRYPALLAPRQVYGLESGVAPRPEH
jgi:MoaA/NifB/PqqE/SkfB family radical SAM enzyme